MNKTNRQNKIPPEEFQRLCDYTLKQGMYNALHCLKDLEIEIVDIPTTKLGERPNLLQELKEIHSICFLSAILFMKTGKCPSLTFDFSMSDYQQEWENLDHKKLLSNYDTKTIIGKQLNRDLILFNFDYIQNEVKKVAQEHHWELISGEQVGELILPLNKINNEVIMLGPGNQGEQSHYTICSLSNAVQTISRSPERYSLFIKEDFLEKQYELVRLRKQDIEMKIKTFQKFNYSEKGSPYQIVAPRNVEDIFNDDFIVKNRLITSWLEKIRENKAAIVFFRHKDQIEKPYFALVLESIFDNWYIRMIRGPVDQTLTDVELGFLKRWSLIYSIKEIDN